MSQTIIKQAMDQSIAEYLNHLDGEAAPKLYNLMMGEAEAALIANALTRCNGNQTHTANMLGISRNTLKKKMQLHGLDES